MKDNPWLGPKEASRLLGVSESTLQLWREIGYLKPGTHWRSSPNDDSLPWKPIVIYHLRWCREVIQYWRDKDSALTNMAA